MKWIGLTGGIGSGKSTVAEILRSKGFQVIDADQLAHAVLSDQGPVRERLVQLFGDGILGSGNRIDREKLGRIVFADRAKLSQLEALVHPEVRRKALEERARLEKLGHNLAFYEIPLLFEKQLHESFDAVVVVFTPEEEQIQRTMKRTGLSRADVVARVAAQMPLDEKVAQAQFVIDNSGDEKELKAQVETLIQELESYQPQV